MSTVVLISIFCQIYGFHGGERGNKQGSPGRPFQHEILRPDAAALEIDVPVVAAEHQDHATSPVLAFRAFIAYNLRMQYTIRKVPNSLDVALRRRAREQGKSLNDVAIEALARGAGVSGERSPTSSKCVLRRGMTVLLPVSKRINGSTRNCIP